MERLSADDELLTPLATAELIGVSVHTLAWWRRRTVNRGPAFVHRDGYKRIAYRLDDVNDFRSRQRVETIARTN